MTEPSIFVSGSSAERHRIAEYVEVLRAAGWRVTYDWTRSRDWEDPDHEEAVHAHRYCLRGVREAWLFWWVTPLPPAKSEGAHAELGAAAALLKPIVASGAVESLGRVFPRFADLTFASHGRALEALVRAALNPAEMLVLRQSLYPVSDRCLNECPESRLSDGRVCGAPSRVRSSASRAW